MVSSRTNGRRIIVTDADTTAALACIRELGMNGHTVFALGRSFDAPAKGSRWTAEYRKSSCPWKEPQAAIEQLMTFAEDVDADCILPVSEATLAATLRWDECFSPNLQLLRARKDVLQIALSKIETFRRAGRFEIPTAAGYVVARGGDLPELNDLDFPCIVRTDNRWLSDGSYAKGQTWIARSREELLAVVLELKGTAESFLIQKWLAGRGCGAFVLMRQGKIEVSHTHERLAEIPWTGGVSARRRLGNDTELIAHADAFFSGLHHDGIAMLEFRRVVSGDSHRPILVEINARPWGSLSLALNAQLPFISRWVEVNNPDFETRDVHSFKKSPNRRDLQLTTTSIYPGEIQFLSSVIQSFIGRELSIAKAARMILSACATIFNVRTRYDFFRWDDPLPCLLQSRLLLRRLFSSFNRRILTMAGCLAYKAVRISRARRNFADVRQILIICSGNRCRSPFVEQLLSASLSSKMKFVSRGLDVHERNIPERFTALFASYGLKPETHRAESLTPSDIESADIVVAMEKQHIWKLLWRYGFAVLKKVRLLSELAHPLSDDDVRDPFNLSPAEAGKEYAKMRRLVEECLSERGLFSNQNPNLSDSSDTNHDCR
jgi:protein-tyrosine phosphatase